jgi:hypothetical protein
VIQDINAILEKEDFDKILHEAFKKSLGKTSHEESENNMDLEKGVGFGDATLDANAILHKALEEALDNMSPEECENQTQLAEDAQKAEEVKRRRWFYTRGYPGMAILNDLSVVLFCFMNYLYKHNLGGFAWVALYMV